MPLELNERQRLLLEDSTAYIRSMDATDVDRLLKSMATWAPLDTDELEADGWNVKKKYLPTHLREDH